MSGIYIIKQKDGSHGYIGLDSGAQGLQSGRLIDHVAHAYNVVGREIKRGSIVQNTYGDIPRNVQNCETGIAKATPSNFDYFLNTDTKNTYYGLPATNYREFSHIWKTKGKHKTQSWAEICYIYFYRNTWSNMNIAWGGNLSYTYDITNLIHVNDLKISKELKDNLMQPIKWRPGHGAYSIADEAHMNALFYPELQLKDRLIEYAQEKIRITIQDLVQTHKKEWIINALRGHQSEMKTILRQKCKEVNKETQTVLLALTQNSSLLDASSSVVFSINNSGMEAIAHALDISQIKNKSTLYAKNNIIKDNLIDITINIKYKNNHTLPNWFPTADDFNLNTFQNVSLGIKENVLTNIFPLALRQANSTLLGIDYNVTQSYFETSLTNLYNGILSRGVSFSEYYNTIINYWKRSIEGPFEQVDFGEKVFNSKLCGIRRKNWPKDVFLTVPLEFFENMKDSENITFNQITVW